MPSLTTYTLLKQEHNARRGEFKTVHGTVQTPAFQNVATAGAIKGGLSAQDLKALFRISSSQERVLMLNSIVREALE